MEPKSVRITDPDHAPTLEEVEAWIGKKASAHWQRISDLIQRNHPGVFEPEWLYGGKKHGWTLRYKKSKSFCTFIPEKKRFAIVIVFGAKEREKVDDLKHKLSQKTSEEYDAAHTYHDGKWLFLNVDSKRKEADIELLLSVKRKPRPDKLS